MKVDSDTRLILDLDGTLLDTSDRHYLLYSDLFDEIGENIDDQPLPKSDFWHKKRMNKSTVELLPSSFSNDQRSEFKSKWLNQIESREYLQHDCVFPRVVGSLKKLREFGAEIYILTRRSNAQNTRRELENRNIDQFVESVLITPHNGPSKLKVINSNIRDISSSDVVIGDSARDIEAGKNSGSKTIGVLSGVRNYDCLSKSEPDILVPSFEWWVRHTVKGTSKQK